MILLDTNAIIFDALRPDRLTRAAQRKIQQGQHAEDLACADISLWEIAMLVSKGRLDPGAPVAEFIDLALTARAIRVLAITPAVAELAASFDNRVGSDPADRLIAATAVHHDAVLITSDKDLKKAGLPVTVLG